MRGRHSPATVSATFEIPGHWLKNREGILERLEAGVRKPAVLKLKGVVVSAGWRMTEAA